MTQRRIALSIGGEGPHGAPPAGEGVAFEPGSADRIGSPRWIYPIFPCPFPYVTSIIMLAIPRNRAQTPRRPLGNFR